jgi:hypothetical protein
MRTWILLSGVLVVSICASVSDGMATSESGPDSVRGYPTVAQPGWPVGLVELPRQESRVFYFDVNGYKTFYFQASPDQTRELILLFSNTRMRDHELCVKERKSKKESILPQGTDYNVSLDVPGAFQMAETASTYEPKLTVYIDLPADRALSERMTVPENIIVNNEIASFPLKGKAAKPKRSVWYAQVEFDDKTPATDHKHMVTTKVTLWEKGLKDGIPIGRVGGKRPIPCRLFRGRNRGSQNGQIMDHDDGGELDDGGEERPSETELEESFI